MTAPARRGVFLAILSLALILALVVVFTDHAGHRNAPGSAGIPATPPPVLGLGAAPAERAHVACADLVDVVALVKEDRTKSEVFAYLDRAVDELGTASTQDRKWLSLASGAQSLRNGLSGDAAATTALGIAVIRDQCRLAGIFLIPARQSRSG